MEQNPHVAILARSVCEESRILQQADQAVSEKTRDFGRCTRSNHVVETKSQAGYCERLRGRVSEKAEDRGREKCGARFCEWDDTLAHDSDPCLTPNVVA